jgi:DNA segregation ATPase FtsK/SpoIIIE-like protein
MTFDAWIAKMLDALKDESGGKQAKRQSARRNVNPVMIREVGADGRPPAPTAPPVHLAPTPPVMPAPAAPPISIPQTFEPQTSLSSMGAPLQAAMDAADRASARAAKLLGKAGAAPKRPGLTAKTATGDVRFARSSEAELVRRKEELRRLEAERRAQEEVDAATRIERQSRKPGWVRFTRTPDRKPSAPMETAAETSAEIVAILPAEALLQPTAQAHEAMTTGALVPAIEQAPAPAVDANESPRPLVEILIPRSPEMARTEFFLGDAAQRVVIEEFDAPELRRAPPMPRIHPREIPAPRNELQRLAALLVAGAESDDDDNDEDFRASRLREIPKAPVREEKRRVRVKAQTQHTSVDSTSSAMPAAVIARSAGEIAEAISAKATKQSSQRASVGDGSPRRFAPRDDGKVIRAKSQPADLYETPALDLLREHEESDFANLAPEILDENARELEGVLDDFGVKGEIVNVRPGPVVTLYELEPAPGVKSSRVIGLADDIARSMSAVSARVAVVQGRNAIGIELPNQDRETVYLRELLASTDFEGSKHRLAIALGKTIGGEPVIVDLARMPHLLVAGTTGSGKSVAINTMILSLLYRLKPEQCRLIMVDPKMLELSVYDGIPHLLTPVVTDPKKAVVALKWAVREMEDRYKKMSKLGVRNIDGFNARLAEAAQKNETITRTVQTGFDRSTGEAVYEQEDMSLEPLPYIVVVVDEMADLMMVAGKDIEGAIQRLAQMARAAGIHLIMATQRPSVDVITGTIKANFPTRISFQVTSKIDSRTILGEQGAEQLLGQGDMLYMAGGGRISRVHGPFVSDNEVEKVVAHLKSQGAPAYLDAITADEDDDEDGDSAAASGDFGGDESADLYDRAVAIVLRDRKCSVSYIQRRLSVGYNKAASLVERMEKEGLVGQANHAGKREILVGNGVDRGAFDD